MQLWEDLSELEGRLGMRYLTHDSEDAFWIRQGAKQHPLAKREAMQKTNNMDTIEERSSSMSSSHSGSSPDGNQRRGVHFSNGTVLGGSGVLENSEAVQPEDTTHTSTKDYLTMSDEEIQKSQEHAMRVGYKISSV